MKDKLDCYNEGLATKSTQQMSRRNSEAFALQWDVTLKAHNKNNNCGFSEWTNKRRASNYPLGGSP